ncbi:hypothetical protein IY73_04345 [Lawsonella clevelandensis]|nr:hypothetical protein IY73_04345 [Lawsonella clevelandensis]
MLVLCVHGGGDGSQRRAGYGHVLFCAVAVRCGCTVLWLHCAVAEVPGRHLGSPGALRTRAEL